MTYWLCGNTIHTEPPRCLVNTSSGLCKPVEGFTEDQQKCPVCFQIN